MSPVSEVMSELAPDLAAPRFVLAVVVFETSLRLFAGFSGVKPKAACLLLKLVKSALERAPVVELDAKPRDNTCVPTFRDKPFAVPSVNAA